VEDRAFKEIDGRQDNVINLKGKQLTKGEECSRIKGKELHMAKSSAAVWRKEIEGSRGKV
jgi:hypothetical protein